MIQRIVLGGVLLFVLAVYPAVNVPLEVNNWTDVVSTGEPISAGIPLPQGAVSDLSKLRITDGSGNTVPCQFKTLSRWWIEKHRDGNANPSAKWVLCDFQPASVPAKNKATFTLKDDNGNIAPSTPIQVTDNAAGITVVTGPLKFVVSKTLGNIFDGVWLDASGNGAFEASEQIVAASNQNGAFIKAGDWTAQGCAAGTIHSSVQQAPERVIIEEQGPMKVVIRAEGKHYAASGGVTKGLYGWRIFYTAYAGKPYVDVHYVLTNNFTEWSGTATLDQPGYNAYVWPFTKYELVLNLGLTGTQTYSLLGETEVSGTVGATPAVLHQGRATYTVTGGTGGTMASGAASVSNGTLGMMVAVRDFGPNAPKELRVEQNKLIFAMFPDTTVNYSLDPISQKGQHMRFSFVNGAIASGKLTGFWKTVDAPLRMLAAPTYYRDTDAWERGYAIPSVPGGGWDRYAPAAWTRLAKTVRGWKTYGYIGEFNGGGDHWNLSSCFWQYLLSGNPAHFEDAESKAFFFNDMVQTHYGYNRFEDFSFYTAAEDHLQAFSLAPHPDVLSQYINTIAFPGRTVNAGTDQPPDQGHMPQMEAVEYYQLTGDPATLDAMKDQGVFAVMSIYYRTYGLYSGWPYSEHKGALVDLEKFRVLPYGPRYVARPMMVADHAYEFTGDDRYFKASKIFMASLLNYSHLSPIGYIADPADYQTYLGNANAVWSANHPGVNPPICFSTSDFQLGIASEGLYSHWRMTGDKNVRDALILAAKAMEVRAGLVNGKYTGFAYSGWGDYPCDGKRYSDVGLSCGYMGSSSESFSGLIFGYLASGRHDLYNVVNDGLTVYKGGANGFDPNCYAINKNCFEIKVINMWEANYRHDNLDSIAPAAVTNLGALAVPGFVQLSWTAPGDNGNTGTAAEYRIKYAKVPLVDFVKRWNAADSTGWPDLRAPLPYDTGALITKARNYQATREISFWNAKGIAADPVPHAAGTAETFSVTGLGKDTVYYFALVSYDKQGNVSGLSNVVTATSLGTEDGVDGVSTDVALYGNRPNPFNPSTEIRYYLPASKAGAVNVAIYDLGGKKIRTLISGKSKPGLQRVSWDGRDNSFKNAASGVYLLKLTCGDVVKERKLVLMK